MNSPRPASIAFFAHERGDARVAKRIAALGDNGWKILGFTFHRDRGKPDVPPAWENIDLGTTFNRRYLRRLFVFAKSAVILWKERDRLGDCSLLYAVNTDNALLALLGRFFAGGTMPLVLELADIQPAMTGGGPVSKLLRFIERQVLSAGRLLVTTSPGFVEHYFRPVQNFTGPIFLLENKIYPSAGLPAALPKESPAENGRPWVIGYFGAFRCERSLLLIRELAGKLGPKVRFELRGYPSGTITDRFADLPGDLPNIRFGGPYAYPNDLPAMYRGVDFNWCFDESDPTGNSAWLLPNRIYEGGNFHTPALTAENTETGRWVAAHHCGWQFAEPLAESIAAFLRSVTPDEWQRMARNAADLPPSTFRGEDDYVRLSEVLREIAV